MSGDQSSVGTSASTDELKERFDKMSEQIDSGAGNEEPDPATAESPPTDRQEGNERRTQT